MIFTIIEVKNFGKNIILNWKLSFTNLNVLPITIFIKMYQYQDFHKNTDSIAQLQEIQVSRRIALLNEQKVRREEQYSFIKDLKEICPNIKFTKRQAKIDKSLQKVLEPEYTPEVKISYDLRNILMLSEWMMAKPDNLEDYLLIPCPKGTRVSVSVGDPPSTKTQLFAKNGMHLLDVKTNLPNNTLLDCIYNKSNKIIYILDVLMYAGRDVVNTDAAFRRFWIKSKFMEDGIRSFDGGVKIKTILDFDFVNPQSVYEVFQKYPMFDDGGKLDGFLFYHKESLYTCGESPLILWLFPFMIDEVLTMYKVNPKYNQERPLNYTNYLDYIKEFTDKMEKKKIYSDASKRRGKKVQIHKYKKEEVNESQVGNVLGSKNMCSYVNRRGRNKEKSKETSQDQEDFSEDLRDDEIRKMEDLEKYGADA